MIQIAYVLCWWLILEIIGLVSFPLVSRLCSRLGDRGYSVSKLVGLVALTFFVWMLASLKLLPFGTVNIVISFLLLAGLSLYLGRKSLRISEWPRKQMIISDSVFTVAFILLLLIVREQPDIYFNGASDALFNNAFIQSILRGGYFPPLDPWLAGETIPYYYGEHVMVAILSWSTRVPPTIAFNIAIAMFAALAVCASYGLGYNITKRRLYGFLAAIFVCIAGFTSGAFQLMAFASHHQILGYSPSGATNIIDWLLWFDFFHALWLIDGAIVHYPYSAFLMGDMHSYSVSPTFQLMYIMLIFAVFQKERLRNTIIWTDTIVDIFVLSLCLGFFFILNTWEYPTYIIFTILAFVLLRVRPIERSNSAFLAAIGGLRLIFRVWLRIWMVVLNYFAVPVAIVVLSFILYLLYYVSGGLNNFTGLGLVSTRVSLAHFLQFGALFLFAAFSLLFISAKKEMLHGRIAILTAATVLLVTVVTAVLIGFQVLIVVVPLALCSLYLIFKSHTKTWREFVLLLFFMSAALIFFGDFIYINDALSVPWERFNTAMKIYLQLWVFFGISAACAVFYVVSSVGKKKRIIWITLLAVLVVSSLIHPIATTTARIGHRYPDWGINRGTLDGMAYMELIDKGDYDAIQWLNREIKGWPVILEASWIDTTPTGRISSFTGLPTVLGWRRCERMWGHDDGYLGERSTDMDIIYNTIDNSEALALLKKYNVEYIYIGNLERELYESDGVGKFASRPGDYTLIYENESVTIYEIR